MSSIITTTSNAQNRYVWVQTEGSDVTRLLCEPHTEIMDDLKRKIFGDSCVKYQAFHRQHYINPGLPIPADSTYTDPIYFKRIDSRRCESFFHNKSADYSFIHFYLFSHSIIHR